MNCIILLLLLFCGGNSCSNGCSCIGNSNRSSCGNNNSCGNSNNSCGSSSSCGSSNACGVRCLEDEGRGGDRDRRPPRPDFPNFTPVDDPAFPGEMTEDARPVDVSRIPENMGNRKAPELSWQFRGLFCLKD